MVEEGVVRLFGISVVEIPKNVLITYQFFRKTVEKTKTAQILQYNHLYN